VSVRTYYMDDCTIPVPAGFLDRTANVLEWKTAEEDSLALLIQREPLARLGAEEAPAAALQHYVSTQTKDYPSRFAGFCLERDEVAASDAGFEMRRKAFRWTSQEDVLYHHQAFVLVGEKVIVLTAAAKARHRAAVDTLLDGALADFRVRGD
jgi:hypothetical protein